MLKQEKGITLITLVITIVVMVILAGVTIFAGASSMQNARITAFQSEMQIVQARVDVAYEEIQAGDTYYDSVGKDIASLSSDLQNKIQTALQGEEVYGFRYYDQEELKKLNVQGIDRELIINLEKREVVSIIGVKKDGTIYYRDDENLNNNRYKVEYEDKNTEVPTFSITMEPKEYSWLFSATNINYQGHVGGGSLKYKMLEETTWQTADGYQFEAKKPGIYQVKLIDNAGNESNVKKVYAYVKSGLVLYYDGAFNTRAGHNVNATIWEDLSGNQNDISLTGFNYNDTSGWGKDYLKLDGVDDCLIRKNPMYDKDRGTPDINVEVVSSKANLSYGSLLNFGKYTNVNGYMDLWTTGNDERIYQVSYNSNREDSEVKSIHTYFTRSMYPLNTYKTVSYGKYDKTSYSYLNGEKIEEKTVDKYTGWQTDKLYIGRDEKAADGNGNFIAGKNYYFKGDIKAIRIYNRALTADEIAINAKIDKEKYNF